MSEPFVLVRPKSETIQNGEPYEDFKQYRDIPEEYTNIFTEVDTGGLFEKANSSNAKFVKEAMKNFRANGTVHAISSYIALRRIPSKLFDSEELISAPSRVDQDGIPLMDSFEKRMEILNKSLLELLLTEHDGIPCEPFEGKREVTCAGAHMMVDTVHSNNYATLYRTHELTYKRAFKGLAMIRELWKRFKENIESVNRQQRRMIWTQYVALQCYRRWRFCTHALNRRIRHTKDIDAAHAYYKYLSKKRGKPIDYQSDYLTMRDPEFYRIVDTYPWLSDEDKGRLIQFEGEMTDKRRECTLPAKFDIALALKTETFSEPVDGSDMYYPMITDSTRAMSTKSLWVLATSFLANVNHHETKDAIIDTLEKCRCYLGWQMFHRDPSIVTGSRHKPIWATSVHPLPDPGTFGQATALAKTFRRDLHDKTLDQMYSKTAPPLRSVFFDQDIPRLIEIANMLSPIAPSRCYLFALMRMFIIKNAPNDDVNFCLKIMESSPYITEMFARLDTAAASYHADFLRLHEVLRLMQESQNAIETCVATITNAAQGAVVNRELAAKMLLPAMDPLTANPLMDERDCYMILDEKARATALKCRQHAEMNIHPDFRKTILADELEKIEREGRALLPPSVIRPPHYGIIELNERVSEGGGTLGDRINAFMIDFYFKDIIPGSDAKRNARTGMWLEYVGKLGGHMVSQTNGSGLDYASTALLDGHTIRSVARALATGRTEEMGMYHSERILNIELVLFGILRTIAWDDRTEKIDNMRAPFTAQTLIDGLTGKNNRLFAETLRKWGQAILSIDRYGRLRPICSVADMMDRVLMDRCMTIPIQKEFEERYCSKSNSLLDVERQTDNYMLKKEQVKFCTTGPRSTASEFTSNIYVLDMGRTD